MFGSRKKSKLKLKSESGQAIVLLTLGLVMLIAFVSLAVDGGIYYSDRRTAQGVADAAVLSAAYAACTGENPQEVAEYVASLSGYSPPNDYYWGSWFDGKPQDEGGNEKGGGLPGGEQGMIVMPPPPDDESKVEVFTPPQSGPYAGMEGYVEVVITSVVDGAFSKIIGADTLTNVVHAVAACETGSTSAEGGSISANSGLILLEPDGTALRVTGQGLVRVDGGSVFVNSVSNKAVEVNGQSDLIAGAIGIVGDYRSTGQSNISPTPVTGLDPIVGPIFPSLVPPQRPNGPCVSFTNGGQQDVTLNPGVYCNIKIAGQGDITLNPGIYWIESGNVTISGQGDMHAHGVMIYFAPSAGSIWISGQGNLFITPMESGPYAGLVVYQDPANGSSSKISGQGDATTYSGTFYMPTSNVTATGQGMSTAAQLIANTLETNGQADVYLTYGEGFYYQEESSGIQISLME